MKFVGILTFMSKINEICWHFNIYGQDKLTGFDD